MINKRKHVTFDWSDVMSGYYIPAIMVRHRTRVNYKAQLQQAF